METGAGRVRGSHVIVGRPAVTGEDRCLVVGNLSFWTTGLREIVQLTTRYSRGMKRGKLPSCVGRLQLPPKGWEDESQSVGRDVFVPD